MASLQSSWHAYHSSIAARQAAFGALPRIERERAYETVRAKRGYAHTIQIDELLEALEI
jgi:hypothetical protein